MVWEEGNLGGIHTLYCMRRWSVTSKNNASAFLNARAYIILAFVTSPSAQARRHSRVSVDLLDQA